MKKEPCKYHCRCMNLDKRCPNPHFMDANCTCEKPFIPASEKEYPSHAHAGISTGNCPICSTTETLDWMDKEREAFMESSHVEASYDDQIGLQVISSPEDVCDYWILRIEEARKEGYEKGFDAGGQTKGGTGRIMYQRGLEQGRKEGFEKGLHDECSRWMNQDCNAHDNAIRQEERERIYKILESSEIGNKTMTLLNNLTSNE